MPNYKKNTKKQIFLKNANVHNLKNVTLSIPRDQFIVITGLSGSGKSSLAFDTIYAEGQRRYIESMSAYARQFLGKIVKPDVEHIKGLPPAIAIEQKVNTANPRSTVGTSTEIYDYLKLLYARVGKTYSPISNKEVKKDDVNDVVQYILSFNKGEKINILAPYNRKKEESTKQTLNGLIQTGNSRIEINDTIYRIDDLLNDKRSLKKNDKINILIDRIKVSHEHDALVRYEDSIDTAFYQGEETCMIKTEDDHTPKKRIFSRRFEADGLNFEEPDVHMFSFNNPLGACPVCEGYGKVIGIDEDLVVPNKQLSLYEDAVVCWRGDKLKKWKEKIIYAAEESGFPIHKPYYQLTDEQKRMLWEGTAYFYGINDFFKFIERKKYKIQYRVMLSRYRGKTICPTCNGTRLKKEASYVKVDNKSIQELVLLPVLSLLNFFNQLVLDEYQANLASRLLLEIKNRLQFLVNVGLGYLTLNRLSSTLSGGESQRINLATSLGSSLVGSLYILDEPSIGLHPKDNNLLIGVLKKLKDIGNTVIVVEHDENIIRASDHIIDLGPFAGRLGGEIVFQGNHKELLKADNSLTAKFLNKKEAIPVPNERRQWHSYIEIVGARENNLKHLNVRFPLNIMTVVTGVSGSGKSSLVDDIFYPALAKVLSLGNIRPGKHDDITGDIHAIDHVEIVDQKPIGRSSRSNPVTYIKAYDDIRALFASQPLSKQNAFKSSHFSFNVKGGRCEECEGEGVINVEMQFMADVSLVCESCNGKRFKDEVLDVKYNGKNIYDVLEMTVEEAIDFLSKSDGKHEKHIIEKLTPLVNVGLGYVKLGQSSNTFSGGESQRIKLASFLGKGEHKGKSLFIFDEPTTGLHFHDIKKLLDSFNALINKGHTIVIIEHNMEVIKSADWIIDLGPGGGDQGGRIIAEGTPEDIIHSKKSYTAKYLKSKLSGNPSI